MEQLIAALVKLFGALGPVVIIIVVLAVIVLPQAMRIFARVRNAASSSGSANCRARKGRG